MRVFNTRSSIDHVFIIHLERAKARAQHVEKLSQVFDCPVSVHAATDAKELCEETINAVHVYDLHQPAYPFGLAETEIACFLSHRAVWHSIIRRKLDTVIIIEDDVSLDEKKFQLALDLWINSGKPEGFVRFREEKRVVHSDTRPCLSSPILPFLGMQLQIVTQSAARQLFDITTKFDRPVDTFLQMHWLHNTPMIDIYPSGITEIDNVLGGTTIQRKSRPLKDKLKREWLRAHYRFQIKRLAMQKSEGNK